MNVSCKDHLRSQCTRPGCWFRHPTPDGRHPQAGSGVPLVTCRNKECTLAYCDYRHATSDGRSPSALVVKLSTGFVQALYLERKLVEVVSEEGLHSLEFGDDYEGALTKAFQERLSRLSEATPYSPVSVDAKDVYVFRSTGERLTLFEKAPDDIDCTKFVPAKVGAVFLWDDKILTQEASKNLALIGSPLLDIFCPNYKKIKVSDKTVIQLERNDKLRELEKTIKFLRDCENLDVSRLHSFFWEIRKEDDRSWLQKVMKEVLKFELLSQLLKDKQSLTSERISRVERGLSFRFTGRVDDGVKEVRKLFSFFETNEVKESCDPMNGHDPTLIRGNVQTTQNHWQDYIKHAKMELGEGHPLLHDEDAPEPLYEDLVLPGIRPNGREFILFRMMR